MTIMDTDKIVAVEKATGSDVEFMGELLWYTIADCRITGDKLEGLFSDLGILNKYMPRAINNRDAFRRSTGAAEVNRHPMNKSKKYLNLLVREVKVEKEEMERQVVREIVDSKNTRLYYKPIASLKVTGENGDYEATFLVDNVSELEEAQVRKVAEQYSINRTHYDGNHVRAIVKNILADCYPVSVRPSGGVLFIPDEFQGTVSAVKGLIKSLNDYGVTDFKSQAWSVPVVNLSEQKEMVGVSLEDQVEAESGSLIKEMKRILDKGGAIRNTTIQSYVEKVRGLQALTKEYEEMLDFKAARAQTATEIALQQAMALMEKVDDDDAQQALF